MIKIVKYANDEIIRFCYASDSPLIPNPFWTSAYLIDGLLIDSGAPASVNDLKQFVESLSSNEKIDKVIITHFHEDHAGGARFLSEDRGLPVYLDKEGIDKVISGYSYPEYRQLTWGKALEPAPKVLLLDMQPIITKSGKYEFELLHLIGHAPDLVVLFEKKQQWCFSSDVILPSYQMIFNEPSEDLHENVEQIHASLQKIFNFTEGMDHLVVYSAAYDPFLNGRELIQQKILEIEAFHKKVNELKNRGFSERKIIKDVFGGEHIVGHFTKGALSRKNFIKSLLKWAI